MDKWHIQSGELSGEVEADNHETAFLSLLESEKPQSLGKIYQAFKINAQGKLAYGTTVYVSTERVLRDAKLMT